MRLIDKDGLISIMNAKADMAWGTPKEVFTSVAGMVNLLPDVDAVPVVRCKDCCWAQAWQDDYGNSGIKCRLFCRETSPTDYCSYGERKGDE